MAGKAYLVGSGQDGVLETVAARALGALRAEGKVRPRVAVSYAPVYGDAKGTRFMSGRMPPLFPGAVLEAFDAGADRAIVERADLVFVSGGDPTLGAKRMNETGAAAWVREAHARGAAVMGVSAGTIVLGAWWADWAEDEAEAEDDAASAVEAAPERSAAQPRRDTLVACVGAVARHVFDTHNEADDWDELRAVADLLRREMPGEEAVFLGIPTGGAIVFDEAGGMEVVGNSPTRLR
jgi:cyanophycinase-like exopeptidase